MVNLTYGLLQSPDGTVVSPGDPYEILSGGTDLIATLDDGTVVAYAPGDIAWICTCIGLVFLMMPGLAFLYSGLVRRKHALSMLLTVMLSWVVVSFQWFFWGYSLAFSDSDNPFIGDLRHFGYMGVLDQPVSGANDKIPMIVYAMYQSGFAGVVTALSIGATAERGRIFPTILFIFCWLTIVYCPIARWVWHPSGWAFNLGVMDYAGGGPIEIVSGVTGLTYSWYLGRRRGYGTEKLMFQPHNISMIVLGTILLWVGWFGFNGGSTFAANVKAGMSISVTNIAGAFGGLAWMIVDYRLERKWSGVGWATGTIAGLVAITPAAGFVGMPAAVFIGAVSSVIANLATAQKRLMKIDDAMDIYACHGVAGICGLVFTGIFGQASVTANDAFSDIDGGWIDQNYIQMGYQFAWICATFGWTAVVTLILMFIIDHIPGFKFRASVDSEIVGLDEVECGEWSYDYAFINRDLEGNYVPGNSSVAGGSEKGLPADPNHLRDQTAPHTEKGPEPASSEPEQAPAQPTRTSSSSS